MSAQAFEIVLAQLYTDSDFRELFLADPTRALEGHDLTTRETQDLLVIDKAGLVMAAHSFQHKKDKRVSSRKRTKPRWANVLNRAKRVFGVSQ